MKDIVKILLEVGKAILDVKGDLSQSQGTRKKDVSEFLSNIAASIEELSGSLKQDIYPSGSCEEIYQHSQNIVPAIGDLIGDDKATELSIKLQEIYEVEMLYGELQNSSVQEKSERLSLLDSAAGYFRATAAFVKVSP